MINPCLVRVACKREKSGSRCRRADVAYISAGYGLKTSYFSFLTNTVRIVILLAIKRNDLSFYVFPERFVSTLCALICVLIKLLNLLISENLEFNNPEILLEFLFTIFLFHKTSVEASFLQYINRNV